MTSINEDQKQEKLVKHTEHILILLVSGALEAGDIGGVEAMNALGCQTCRLPSCPLARSQSRKMILLGSSLRSTLHSPETLEGQSSMSPTPYA